MTKITKNSCALCLYLMVSLLMACNNTKAQDQLLNQKGMQNLDSLLASYKTTPTYYVEYSSQDCQFELHINDKMVDQLKSRATIGLFTVCINPCILKSGKNKVSLKLFPSPDESMIIADDFPDFGPFTLKIYYVDRMLPSQQQVKINVLQMPQIQTNPKDGGIPHYEYEGEFDAVVPYQVEGWDKCIDLRNIPDIEKRVVDEYKRVRQMMVNQEFDNLKSYFALKNNETAVISYKSTAACEEDWNEYVAEIKCGSIYGFKPIEDYKFEYSEDGRLVALRSTKMRGHSESPLFTIIQEKNDPKWDAYFFPIYLGIKEGTNELVPIMGM